MYLPPLLPIRRERAIEENDSGESGLQELGIDDLNEFVSQTQAQVDSTLSFPSSADIRSNANDLEFFTSSNFEVPTPKEVITHLPISNPPYLLRTPPHPSSQARIITNSSNHLMVAVVLLQTIWLFHQRVSSLYHEMWVMVRPPILFSSGLELTWFSVSIIHRNAAYVPPDMYSYGQGSLGTLWDDFTK